MTTATDLNEIMVRNATGYLPMLADLADKKEGERAASKAIESWIKGVLTETGDKKECASIVAAIHAAKVTEWVRTHTGMEQERFTEQKKRLIDNPVRTVKSHLVKLTGFDFTSNRPKRDDVNAGDAAYEMEVGAAKSRERVTAKEAAEPEAKADTGDTVTIDLTNIEQAMNLMILNFGLEAVTARCLNRYITNEATVQIMAKLKAAKDAGKTPTLKVA